MVAVLVLFMVIISGSLFTLCFFDEPMEKTISSWLIVISLILLFFGMTNKLLLGLNIIVAMAAVLYCAMVYYCVRNRRELRIILKRVFSPAFFTISAFFFIVMIANRGMRPNSFDEFSHWMIALKSMCYHDALFTRSHDSIISSGYPQGITVFQYFFARWIMLFRQTDIMPVGAGYAALQFLQISFVFPLVGKKNYNGILYFILTVLSIFIFPLIFFCGMYKNSYVDALLGILIGSSIASVALTPQEDKNTFYHIRIFLECIFLVLTKRTGFLLAMALMGAYALDELFQYKKRLQISLRKSVIRIIGIFLAVIIPYIMFSLEVKQDILARQLLVGNVEPGVVEEKFFKPWNIGPFIERFFSQSYSLGHTSIQISYFCFIIVCAALFFAVSYLYGYKYAKEQWRIRLIGGYSFFVILSWSAFFLFVYTFVLGQFEAGHLYSFDRYITPGLMPIAYIILFSLLNILGDIDGQKQKFLIWGGIVALSIMTPIDEPVKHLDGTYRKEAYAFYKPIEKLNRKLDEIPLTDNDAVYYISQDDDNTDYLQLRYYEYPVPFPSYGPYRFYEETESVRQYDMLYGDTMGAEELKDLWEQKGITYVAILHINQYFVNEFSPLFDADTEIEESTVYSFDSDTGLLVKVP